MIKKELKNVTVFMPEDLQMNFPTGIESINYFQDHFIINKPLEDRKVTLIGATFEISIIGALDIHFEWDDKHYKINRENGEVIERLD